MHTLIALAVGLTGVWAEPATDWRFAREGQGEHRAAMDEAELKPFDAALFSKLSDWQNGAPLTEEAIAGKVVAIVFWDNEQPASLRAVVPTLKRLELQYADKGLVTLAVHGPEHWDEAQARIASGLISNLTAHDADGSFARALGADGVPDSFVIDRAGQLRFADLDDRELAGAVRGLIRESRDEALTAGQRRAAHAERIQTDERAGAEKERPGAGEGADLPARPTDGAYAAAEWPQFNRPEDPTRLYARDVQGKPLPVPFGEHELWLGEKPELEGRVIVLDFWATWCGPCLAASPKLDALQKKYRDDLRVIGVSGQSRPNYPEDEAAIRQFIRGHKVSYAHVNDVDQHVYRSLQIRAIPHVVVLSSDGIVRWQGNPHDPAFEKAVEKVIAVDPWVAARRGMP
ncbi:MAG: hypothetical protein Kow0022_14280 [Phycisphaerales bacterium]